MSNFDNSNKLPIIQENKSMSMPSKNKLMVSFDTAKRLGKILGLSSIATVGMGIGLVSSAPLAVAGGLSAFSIAGFRAIQNMRYKTEPNLMFGARKKGDKLVIEQDLSFKALSKMNGLDKMEKGEMMLLQSLVALSRYKEMLKGKPVSVSDDGKNVYEQKFSTVTHGINIKTFSALEKLGYIKIDSTDEKKHDSLLILEKLGFLEFKEIGKIAKLRLTGNKDELNKYKKQLKEINFKLTDKPINFEELYEKFGNLNNIEDKKEKYALQRIGSIFDKKGILATKDINIVKDSFGRDTIKYKSEKNFIAIMEEKNPEIKEKGRNDVLKNLKRGVDLEKIETARNEFMNSQSLKSEKSNDIDSMTRN